MLGGDEWVIIAIVALLIFGAGQLPKLARNLGEAQKEFKRAMREEGDGDGSGDAPSGGSAESGTSAPEAIAAGTSTDTTPPEKPAT